MLAIPVAIIRRRLADSRRAAWVSASFPVGFRRTIACRSRVPRWRPRRAAPGPPRPRRATTATRRSGRGVVSGRAGPPVGARCVQPCGCSSLLVVVRCPSRELRLVVAGPAWPGSGNAVVAGGAGGALDGLVGAVLKLVTASAAETMLRWASVYSRLRWQAGRDFRSYLTGLGRVSAEDVMTPEVRPAQRRRRRRPRRP